MRTKENWEKIKWKYLSKFPLRVQKDLEKYSIPNINVVEDSMFIYGDVRTGKTVLAANLMFLELRDIYLNAIPDCHNKTLFVSFPDMLQDLKSTFTSQEDYNTVLKKYLDAHFLVIDDFITSRPTDWVLEIIYHVINYRYEKMKKTVITSNFSLKELEDILHEQRITSRISRSYTIVKKVPYV